MSSHGPTVGVISNPGSGHNREQFEHIRERLERCPTIAHEITYQAGDIPAALAALAELQVSVLAINGGDGTASAILAEMLESHYFQHTPTIVLLPGGTANMNAGDIGLGGSLRKATERFCRWCESGSPDVGKRHRRALMRVVTDSSATPHYGMFLGAGAIIQGTEYAHKEVHSRGLRDDFSLALATLRTTWGVLRGDPAFRQHVAIRLRLDDQPAAGHDALILAISTLQRLAFGMQPFWGSENGGLRITLIEQQCSRFARTFFSIVRGKPSRNAVPQEGYSSHNAQAISLELHGKMNLDGEILSVSGPVHITASPTLEFLVL
tara:strand:+ start:43839 stop:44804 length:966 start_codon:yes stop_codon:yes gene_type:complete